MNTYRAANGRLIPRRGNGRFRKTSLHDFGIATQDLATGPHQCQDCGSVWLPILKSGKCPGCGAMGGVNFI